MTEAEARTEATRRNAATTVAGLWAAQRAAEGGWRVVHLVTPGMRAPQPTGAHVESKPKPPQADDPRTALDRNLPAYGP